jgi:hypothetical protein
VAATLGAPKLIDAATGSVEGTSTGGVYPTTVDGGVLGKEVVASVWLPESVVVTDSGDGGGYSGVDGVLSGKL